MAQPSLTLHPRAAPGDRLRVWVGAFQHTTAPALTWRLDGQETVPRPVAPIASVRLVQQGWVKPDEPRAFTGVYEFELPTASRRDHVVEVMADGELSARLDARTVPRRVPESPDETFNVLLASCFHGSQDPAGRAGIAVSRLPRSHRPDLALLLGDQVYLDLPLLMQPLPRGSVSLSRLFEQEYSRNWREPEAYSSVIGAAPSVAMPDDHEYWNNFPHRATALPITYTKGGRDSWRPVAQRLFAAFQAPDPNRVGEPFVLDVPPLSFFVLDSRTWRTRNRQQSITPGALSELKSWVDRVLAEDLYAVIATGQSYFEEGAGFMGRFTDFKLPNYKDFEPQVRQILRLAFDGTNPVITITGDVHWGRLLTASAPGAGGALVHEVISSPTSLVADPRNAGKRARHAIGRLFGRDDDPWYLHSDPAQPPGRFGVADAPARRLTPKSLHGQKGNHVAVLTFRRAGLGLDLRVSFWPIHGPDKPLRPDYESEIRLRPRP